jgi:hypothetical protein
MATRHDFLAQLKLGLGKIAFAAKRWQDAEQSFQDVVDRHSQIDAAAEALYWAGVSRYKATGDASALAQTTAAFAARFRTVRGRRRHRSGRPERIARGLDGPEWPLR